MLRNSHPAGSGYQLEDLSLKLYSHSILRLRKINCSFKELGKMTNGAEGGLNLTGHSLRVALKHERLDEISI